MRLKRLEVDGGFLDGLDLTFAPGLNVLIGARGSGKTSVIEVLRYCLGVRAVTGEAQKRAVEHALWVLGEGHATLTVETEGVDRVIRRGIHEDAQTPVATDQMLFVSQKEIEAIGLDRDGRRTILDKFAQRVLTAANAPSPGVATEVEKLARTLFDARSELESVTEELGQLENVPDELKAAEGQQASTQQEGTELAELQARAKELSHAIGELVEQEEAHRSSLEQLLAWRERIAAARDAAPDLGRLPKPTRTELDPELVDIRRQLDRALAVTETAVDSLRAKVEDLLMRLNARRRELADIGARIESLEEGAGKLARAVAVLREKQKRSDVLSERRDELRARIENISRLRAAALNELADTFDERFRSRSNAADDLNNRFGGEIRVEVVKAGDVGPYEAALGRALQNSGLQWRDLARQISERMSPRELVDAVEAFDPEVVVAATGISASRAQRLVGHLASADLTEVVLANVDEDVEFSLLDGMEYKSTGRLSLGQRCTVVLPLLLAQDPDVAVLDQPEDHLDNAFIVETVVDVLRSRRADAQRIIATHNANIPVLGEADQVIVLESSGRTAFVDQAAPLDDLDIVSAISRLMEGGADAFRRRARFYGT